MADATVWGGADTPHAGRQPRYVRCTKSPGGVTLEVQGMLPGVELGPADAAILAAMLVALSKPERTDP